MSSLKLPSRKEKPRKQKVFDSTLGYPGEGPPKAESGGGKPAKNRAPHQGGGDRGTKGGKTGRAGTTLPSKPIRGPLPHRVHARSTPPELVFDPDVEAMAFSAQQRSLEKPKGLVCVECKYGLACTRPSHLHWVNNKGKGDKEGAARRLLERKVRSAKQCPLGLKCERRDCHCHPFTYNKNGVKTRVHQVSAKMTAEEAKAAVHAPDGVPPPVAPEPAPAIPPTNATDGMEEGEEQKEPAVTAAPAHPTNAQVIEDVVEARVQWILDGSASPRKPPFIMETLDDGVFVPTAPQLPAGTRPADESVTTGISPPQGGAPTPKGGAGKAPENHSPVGELAARSVTNPMYLSATSFYKMERAIIFHNGNAAQYKRWRTVKELSQDALFAIRTHLSSVNPDYACQEEEQIMTARPMARRKVTPWRRPKVGLRQGRLGLRLNVRMSAKREVGERIRKDDTLNLFLGTYESYSNVRTFTELYKYLLYHNHLYSKTAVDASGRVLTSYVTRIHDLLKSEQPQALRLWREADSMAVEYTIARFVNHVALTNLFANKLQSQQQLQDTPMLNDSRAPSSTAPRS